MAGGLQSSNVKSNYVEGQNYTMPLIVVTNLFFIWAFVTSLNDILIPYLKQLCNLTNFESSFVQSAFFIAYFVFSIPSAAIIKKTGYKKGMLLGLGLMFLGSLIFIPAAQTKEYYIFLVGLFVLASGITFLQVAANPYVAVLGKPATASSRLNLTQAFNSLGATVGPLIGGGLILKNMHGNVDDVSNVIASYVGLAIILLIIGIIIWKSKLPEVEEESSIVASGSESGQSIFQFKHLMLGVGAIFFYVGAEVAIGSFLIAFAGETVGADVDVAKIYPTYYMGLAMIGRFAGSWILSKVSPGKLLGFNAFIAIVLLVTAVYTTGSTALYCVVLVGLCNSIMFPTIFTLAIQDLGSFTKQGSSFLIMAIVGGAFIPSITAKVADMQGIQFSFLIPAICYVYICYYGYKGSKVKPRMIVSDPADTKDISNAKTLATEIPL